MISAARIQSARSEEQPHLIRFCGHAFEALPSGALFWRAENMLLVADLHFGKMASFARGGQLLPPYDTGLTLTRLETDLQATGATKLMALGDSFHRDDSADHMLPEDRLRLKNMMQGIAWTWIAGNHDPSPHNISSHNIGSVGFGSMCCTSIEHRGVTLVHEPSSTGAAHIAGHLHPAARVRINGRSVRKPCFVTDGRLLILPAYGASTGHINILGHAFNGLFDRTKLEVVMLGSDRVFGVNPRRLCVG